MSRTTERCSAFEAGTVSVEGLPDGSLLSGSVLDLGEPLPDALLVLWPLDGSRLGGAGFRSRAVWPRLLGAAEDYEIALLPGGVTASECMALLEWGYAIQKFFPAEPAGGVPYLSSLASPLPQIRFCPTGGITPEKAKDYLKLSNVITVGGSWMAPKALIAAKDWAAIERLAAEAAGLKGA